MKNTSRQTDCRFKLGFRRLRVDFIPWLECCRLIGTQIHDNLLLQLTTPGSNLLQMKFERRCSFFCLLRCREGLHGS